MGESVCWDHRPHTTPQLFYKLPCFRLSHLRSSYSGLPAFTPSPLPPVAYYWRKSCKRFRIIRRTTSAGGSSSNIACSNKRMPGPTQPIRAAPCDSDTCVKQNKLFVVFRCCFTIYIYVMHRIVPTIVARTVLRSYYLVSVRIVVCKLTQGTQNLKLIQFMKENMRTNNRTLNNGWDSGKVYRDEPKRDNQLNVTRSLHSLRCTCDGRPRLMITMSCYFATSLNSHIQGIRF